MRRPPTQDQHLWKVSLAFIKQVLPKTLPLIVFRFPSVVNVCDTFQRCGAWINGRCIASVTISNIFCSTRLKVVITLGSFHWTWFYCHVQWKLSGAISTHFATKKVDFSTSSIHKLNLLKAVNFSDWRNFCTNAFNMYRLIAILSAAYEILISVSKNIGFRYYITGVQSYRGVLKLIFVATLQDKS